MNHFGSHERLQQCISYTSLLDDCDNLMLQKIRKALIDHTGVLEKFRQIAY